MDIPASYLDLPSGISFISRKLCFKRWSDHLMCQDRWGITTQRVSFAADDLKNVRPQDLVPLEAAFKTRVNIVRFPLRRLEDVIFLDIYCMSSTIYVCFLMFFVCCINSVMFCRHATVLFVLCTCYRFIFVTYVHVTYVHCWHCCNAK